MPRLEGSMVELGARYLERRRAWDPASLVPPSESGGQPPAPDGDRDVVSRRRRAELVEFVVALTAQEGVTTAADLTWDVAERVVALAFSRHSRGSGGAARDLFAWIVAPELVDAAARQARIPELHVHAPREPSSATAGAEPVGPADSGGTAQSYLGPFLYWCGFHGWTDVRTLRATALDGYAAFLETRFRPGYAQVLAATARAFVRWAPSTAPEFDATHRALGGLCVKRGFDSGTPRHSGSTHTEAFLNRRSALRLQVLPWLASRGLKPEDLRREQFQELLADMARLPSLGEQRRELVVNVAVDLYRTMVPLAFQESVAQPVWVSQRGDGDSPSSTGDPADLIRRLCVAPGGVGWSGQGVGPLLDVLAMEATEADREDGLDRPLRTLAGIGHPPGYPDGVPLNPGLLGVWANRVNVGRYSGHEVAYFLSDAGRSAWQAMRLLSPPPSPDDAGAVLRAAATSVAEAWPPARGYTRARIIRVIAGHPGGPTTDEIVIRVPPERSPSGSTGMSLANAGIFLDWLRRDGVVHPYGPRPMRWGLAPGLPTCISRWLASSSRFRDRVVTVTADEIHAHGEHMQHVAIGAIARTMALPGAVEVLTRLSSGDRGSKRQGVKVALVRGQEGMTDVTLGAMRDARLITLVHGRVRIGSSAVVDALSALQALAVERMRGPIRVVIGPPSADGPRPAGGGVE